jgi:serine/threonine-protein kinase
MRCPSCGRQNPETTRFCPDCGTATGSAPDSGAALSETVVAVGATTLPARIGRFEIRRELGRGAMGLVYDGWDPVIERRVAVKTLRRGQFEPEEGDEIVERFRREAQAAGRLTHPNVVAIHDYGESDGVAYIAMEFVDGRSLKSCLDAGERFALPEVVSIMTQLLDALHYSHQRGVVHRDIKPANIMLLAGGTVKVTDFGVARIESSSLTRAGVVVGTPLYMSPEQFAGTPADGRSDLFSAGVVLYQLLTGEKPFTGAAVTTIMHKVLFETPPPPSRLNVHVPAPFDEVVARALAKRPDDRYPNARAFAEALRAAAVPAVPVAGSGAKPVAPDGNRAANQSSARSAGGAANAPAAPPRIARRRAPLLLAAIGGSVLLALGALVGPWLAKRPAEPAPIAAPAGEGERASAAAPARKPAPRAAPAPPAAGRSAAAPAETHRPARPAAADKPPAPVGSGWREQLRGEIEGCGRFSFPRRQYCIERARWKYCSPDRWSAAPECGLPAE